MRRVSTMLCRKASTPAAGGNMVLVATACTPVVSAATCCDAYSARYALPLILHPPHIQSVATVPAEVSAHQQTHRHGCAARQSQSDIAERNLVNVRPDH